MMNTNAQFWDEIAEQYAAKPVADVPAYQRKLEITKARLHPTDVILDIGCGTGSLALELSPHVSQVHAIDISSEMIKIANQKAVEQNISNVTFYNATLAESFAFEAESLDCICAYNILHLVDDRIAAMRKVFDSLKPGGFFISSTVCLGGSMVPYGLILPVMRWFGKAPVVHIFDVATLEAKMSEIGFVNITRHDVGAKKTTAFIVAEKPESAA